MLAERPGGLTDLGASAVPSQMRLMQEESDEEEAKPAAKAAAKESSEEESSEVSTQPTGSPALHCPVSRGAACCPPPPFYSAPVG